MAWTFTNLRWEHKVRHIPHLLFSAHIGVTHTFHFGKDRADSWICGLVALLIDEHPPEKKKKTSCQACQELSHTFNPNNMSAAHRRGLAQRYYWHVAISTPHVDLHSMVMQYHCAPTGFCLDKTVTPQCNAISSRFLRESAVWIQQVKMQGVPTDMIGSPYFSQMCISFAPPELMLLNRILSVRNYQIKWLIFRVRPTRLSSQRPHLEFI